MDNTLPATNEAWTTFAPHVGDVPTAQCSLSHILVGLLHVFAWAGHARITLPQGMTVRALGRHVGCSAVFRAGDRLLKGHAGKKATAALHLALEVLCDWIFPAGGRFGRTDANALKAMAGVM